MSLVSVLRVFLHSGAVVTFLAPPVAFISYLPMFRQQRTRQSKAKQSKASTQKGERRTRLSRRCRRRQRRRRAPLTSPWISYRTMYVRGGRQPKKKIKNKRGGRMKREGASLLRELNAVHTQPAYYLLKNKTRRRSNCLLLLLLL
jgi:hypothetical protein